MLLKDRPNFMLKRAATRPARRRSVFFPAMNGALVDAEPDPKCRLALAHELAGFANQLCIHSATMRYA